MGFTSQKFITYANLTEFLTKLKAGLAAELTSNTRIPVKVAEQAVKDANGDTITTTYLKSTDAANTYVPLTVVIGDNSTGKVKNTDYVDFTGNVDPAHLRTVLNVENDSEKNVIVGVQVKGNGENAFSDLTPDANRKVQIDLSGYAKLTDITSVFKFKGIKANVASLPASGNVEGDVWHVTADDGEYVWLASGDSPEGAHWELISHNLSNYYTKSEVYTTTEVDTAIKTATSPIITRVNAIYTPASGTQGEEGYVAASGLLVDEVTRATAAESGLQSAINTLNGNDTTAGSVAKSIKDAIGALDYGITGAAGQQPAGDYVTGVTQTDGVIAVSRAVKGSIAANSTGLVDGQTVYNYITTELATGISGLDVADIGAAGSYIQVVGETDGKIHATPATFDTGIAAYGTLAAEGNTGTVPASSTSASYSSTNAPTTAAVRNYVNDLYASITAATKNEIDAMFTA